MHFEARNSFTFITHFRVLAPLRTRNEDDRNHTILGGKVHVYRRPKSSRWQCSTYLAGKNRRRTTKEDSLSKAKEIAEDWYLQLRASSAAAKSRPKKPFPTRPNSSCGSTRSSPRANVTKVRQSSTRARGCIWCRSSATWAFRKSPPVRSRNTAFTGSRRPWRNTASRRAGAPSIRKSWSCGKR